MHETTEPIYRWLTRAQVAHKLGIHPGTVYKLEKRPGFPQRSTALGNPRWREDEIERYMQEGRHHSKPDTESRAEPGNRRRSARRTDWRPEAQRDEARSAAGRGF